MKKFVVRGDFQATEQRKRSLATVGRSCIVGRSYIVVLTITEAHYHRAEPSGFHDVCIIHGCVVRRQL